MQNNLPTKKFSVAFIPFVIKLLSKTKALFKLMALLVRINIEDKKQKIFVLDKEYKRKLIHLKSLYNVYMDTQ